MPTRRGLFQILFGAAAAALGARTATVAEDGPEAIAPIPRPYVVEGIGPPRDYCPYTFGAEAGQTVYAGEMVTVGSDGKVYGVVRPLRRGPDGRLGVDAG